ncbi:hypothetical protein LIER_00123 [Lithospermum erythrorhizon]|uniref:Uncharacterized protein n=1 Tax=Lithospermum erythrorhizon TaxID=34254 RepID=A0AAV3NGS9_LITER
MSCQSCSSNTLSWKKRSCYPKKCLMQELGERNPSMSGNMDLPKKEECGIDGDREVNKEGPLQEFMKNDQMGSPRSYREPSPQKYANDRRGNDRSPRITGRVDTISGGITGGGDTSNARRKYARKGCLCRGLLYCHP